MIGKVLAGSEFWLWIERPSWAVTLAAFPILLYQLRVLRRDQRRIADDVARRSQIEFGFQPPDEPFGSALRSEIVREATWGRGSNVSEPVHVTFLARNAGTRTAHNLLFNLRFPPAVEEIPNGPNVVRDADGSLVIAERVEHIHPGVIQRFNMALLIPIGLSALPIEVTATMDDTPESRFDVNIRIKPQRRAADHRVVAQG